MKKRFSSILMVTFALAIVSVLLTGTNAVAKKPVLAPGCPFENILCILVFDPVICEDGNVYSNSCFALQACQFDCDPFGGYLE